MVTVATKAVGATAKAVGVLYVEPDLQVGDAGSRTALESGGMNAPFVADLLSACLAHERCGVQLYRSVSGRTTMPELGERYSEFLTETEEHVELLEGLIRDTGGNPMYVSPSARATERADAGLVEATWILDGSVDNVTAELAMLEAVLLAEVKDHDNWELLRALAEVMPPGTVQDTMRSVATQVLKQEDEHFQWARQTRHRMLHVAATGQEPSPTASGRRGGADGEVTKEQLYNQAKELDIPGRGAMTKDELAVAVAEAEQEATS